jgi:hypothetical protein
MLAARFAFYAGASDYIRVVATVTDIVVRALALSFSMLGSRHEDMRESLFNI